MYKQGTKYIYEFGDRIGPLRIMFIEELPSKGGHRYGKFLCPKCNKNLFRAKIDTVKSGYSKQCSVCRAEQNLEHCKEMQQNRRLDITGKKFGKLTALYPIENIKANSIVWMCECDCSAKTRIPVTLNHLRTGHTQSCGCIISKGEEKVAQILSQLDIAFEKQKNFQELRSETNKPLYFDFYLPDYNICIEYDGEQHFSKNYRGWFTKENQEQIQKRDTIKNNYCKKCNIKLIRIPYWDYSKLNSEYIKARIEE